MFENVLELKGVSGKLRVTYKLLVSVGLIALAVVLPQIVHLALGQPGGAKFLPMYFPVLIGGCLLGSKWAELTGLLAPLVSFLFTSALGTAMPTLERLPFMMIELWIFAVVSGLFSKKIYQNGLWVFVAVIVAQIAGRLSFLGLAALLQSFVSFTPTMIWNQILTGIPGIIIEIVLVPAIVLVLRKIMKKEQ